ncbi:MAG: hypothetical protein JRH06_06565 [Deltaproteobacteria bacterium]|nr:hypothetical protein [Deltaproteobacteria bacterium]MBW2137202.1 hypothetical protein [Deltaproteobacteria bacterium]
MENAEKSKAIKTALSILLIPLAIIFLMSPCETEGSNGVSPLRKKWKVLHIMSYHSPWKWTDDQFNGFKYALRDLDVEYRVFQMDTKRRNSKEWMDKAGREARRLIETWRPDLVYTTDDYAQEYVTSHYINKDIPFVFSGVNGNPREYGFFGSSNITGVLEEEHFIPSVRLLKRIVPGVKKIAVIVDTGKTWEGVLKRMRQKLDRLPTGMEIVSWDVIRTFEEYKQRMKDYQAKVDAIALLGIFTYKDKKGNNVPYRKVLRWTAENSRLPDFSFWRDRISYGTLCTVTVSGYEQGLVAGRIARGILAEGRSPSSYAMEPTVKGEPVISLARARKLGIKIESSLLLAVQVVTQFAWEKEE